MGIDGLLRTLKGALAPIHLRELKGQTCAVDSYAWIHRGIYTCATDLCMEKETDGYVRFCMTMVDCLVFHGITPVMVFDGARLGAKEGVEKARATRRTQGMEEGVKFLAEGKQREATNAFSRAVDVTPEMARKVILALRKKGIKVIVAPFEADAQLAYLNINGHVDFVVSEDSDLLAFGCTKVLYKFDRASCSGQLVDSRKLHLAEEIYLRHFTDEMFLDMCVLSGCDYLEGLQGVGIKTAHKLVQKYKSTTSLLRGIRFECKSARIPVDYELRFHRAKLTFKHQMVFCPVAKAFIHPNAPIRCEDYPEITAENGELSFLGVINERIVDRVEQWINGDLNVETFDLFPQTTSLEELETPKQVIQPKAYPYGARANSLPNPAMAQTNSIATYFKTGPSTSNLKPTRISTCNPWISSLPLKTSETKSLIKSQSYPGPMAGSSDKTAFSSKFFGKSTTMVSTNNAGEHLSDIPSALSRTAVNQADFVSPTSDSIKCLPTDVLVLQDEAEGFLIRREIKNENLMESSENFERRRDIQIHQITSNDINASDIGDEESQKVGSVRTLGKPPDSATAVRRSISSWRMGGASQPPLKRFKAEAAVPEEEIRQIVNASDTNTQVIMPAVRVEPFIDYEVIPAIVMRSNSSSTIRTSPTFDMYDDDDAVDSPRNENDSGQDPSKVVPVKVGKPALTTVSLLAAAENLASDEIDEPAMVSTEVRTRFAKYFYTASKS